MHGTVIEKLREWQGQAVFFHPLHGNNGDKLIELGARRAIDLAGVSLVSSPAKANLIIFNGGAGLTDVWEHGFATLQTLSSSHPTTPLIVLPSTIQFSDPQQLQRNLAGRQTPIFVYCREQHSLDRLQESALPEHVVLGLDHDMAFSLQESNFLTMLRNKSEDRHVLLVERGDKEGVTGARQQSMGRFPLKKYAPIAFKRYVKRRVLSRQAKNSPLASAVHAFLQENAPSSSQLPMICFDASSPELINFKHFCLLIAKSDCVFTTRLHVGILAAMLGKQTFIFEGLKKLSKISGIYDFSLSDMPHVKLVRFDSGSVSVV